MLKAPFDVGLADGTTITVERILRWLPGRRLAACAAIDGRRVFVKIHSGQRSRAEKEVEKRALLAAGGIAVPAVLKLSACRTAALPPPASAVVCEWLDGGVDLSAFLARPGDDDALRALCTWAELMGKLARAGLKHGDPHFANFMIAGGAMHAVDVDDVEAVRGIRTTAAIRRDFAEAAAQIDPRLDHLLDRVAAAFAQASQIPTFGAREIGADLRRARARRRTRYFRKLERSCTACREERRGKDHMLIAAGVATADVVAALETLARDAARSLVAAGDALILADTWRGAGFVAARRARSMALHGWHWSHWLGLHDVPALAPMALVTSAGLQNETTVRLLRRVPAPMAGADASFDAAAVDRAVLALANRLAQLELEPAGRSLHVALSAGKVRDVEVVIDDVHTLTGRPPSRSESFAARTARIRAAFDIGPLRRADA